MINAYSYRSVSIHDSFVGLMSGTEDESSGMQREPRFKYWSAYIYIMPDITFSIPEEVYKKDERAQGNQMDRSSEEGYCRLRLSLRGG